MVCQIYGEHKCHRYLHLTRRFTISFHTIANTFSIVPNSTNRYERATDVVQRTSIGLRVDLSSCPSFAKAWYDLHRDVVEMTSACRAHSCHPTPDITLLQTVNGSLSDTLSQLLRTAYNTCLVVAQVFVSMEEY